MAFQISLAFSRSNPGLVNTATVAPGVRYVCMVLLRIANQRWKGSSLNSVASRIKRLCYVQQGQASVKIHRGSEARHKLFLGLLGREQRTQGPIGML